MHPERTKLYLEQVLDAIGKINESTIGLSLTAYEHHEIKWLVERGLEVIGEALNRLKYHQPDLIIENSSKIIGTRNKIAHEYDVVDHAVLFSIVTLHLPRLKEEVERILHNQF